MPSVLRHHVFAEEEYLALERSAGTRSEYFRGHILAMAGGSLRHNRLTASVIGLLHARLRGTPCQASSSDQRLMTPDRLYTYPDAAVYCGPIQTRPGAADVALNPILLVEVLSPSTREYDCGDKLAAYQKLPSLRHVLLIEAEEARVVLHSRVGRSWMQTVVEGLDADVALAALQITLPLAELYAGVVGPDGPLPV